VKSGLLEERMGSARGAEFPANCFVELPLAAQDYYRLYFATDGDCTFRNLVGEVRHMRLSCPPCGAAAVLPARPKPRASPKVPTQTAALEWLLASSCPGSARAARLGRLDAHGPLRPAQVQDRAVESSEIWREGRLLYERLQTLPNYEKCAAAARPVRPAWSLRCADTERTALPRRWVRSHLGTGPPWKAAFPCAVLVVLECTASRTAEGREGAAVSLHDDLPWRLPRHRLVRCMEKRWSNLWWPYGM